MKTFLTAIFMLLCLPFSVMAHDTPGPLIEKLISDATAEIEDGDFKGFLRVLDPELRFQETMPTVIAIMEQHLSEDPRFKVLFVSDTGQSGVTIISIVEGSQKGFFFSTTYLKEKDSLRLIHFSAQGNYKDIIIYK